MRSACQISRGGWQKTHGGANLRPSHCSKEGAGKSRGQLRARELCRDVAVPLMPAQPCWHFSLSFCRAWACGSGCLWRGCTAAMPVLGLSLCAWLQPPCMAAVLVPSCAGMAMDRCQGQITEAWPPVQGDSPTFISWRGPAPPGLSPGPEAAQGSLHWGWSRSWPPAVAFQPSQQFPEPSTTARSPRRFYPGLHDGEWPGHCPQDQPHFLLPMSPCLELPHGCPGGAGAAGAAVPEHRPQRKPAWGALWQRERQQGCARLLTPVRRAIALTLLKCNLLKGNRSGRMHPTAAAKQRWNHHHHKKAGNLH